MDFDNVKENIQPLATGRNVSLLQASLRNDSPQEILAQRKEFEEAIKTYDGSDPLEPWYTYICWIEQSYPSGGSESGLQRVLSTCLARFENDERYNQDRRFIRLFIKFMANQKDQIEVYQELFNNGIGTMVADFYIAWAYSYDLCGNTRRADEIFRQGIACRAEPFEELQEAHQHFGYSLSQRMLYMDGDRVDDVNQQLNERRAALQSLRSHQKKGTVGSIRTGAAIKSETPGIIPNDAPSTSRRQNNVKNLEVFQDENRNTNALPQQSTASCESQVETGKTTLRSIIDAARHQENLKETGTWNKAHDKKKHTKLFSGSTHAELSFTIHNDEFQSNFPPITNFERTLEKPFKFPPQFASHSKKQTDSLVAITLEHQPDPYTLPQYNKCMLYPRPNVEFSPEEYRAYRFFIKHAPDHPYVKRYHCYWAIGDPNVNLRRYPNFACESKPQKQDELDNYWKPPANSGLFINFAKHYNDEENEEYQIEELLAKKSRFSKNDTIHNVVDMEETVCVVDNLPRRKSFFPTPVSRKSVCSGAKPKIGRPSVVPRTSIVHEESEISMKFDNIALSPKVTPIECPSVSSTCKENSVFLVPDVPQTIDLVKSPAASLPTPTEKKFEIFEDNSICPPPAVPAASSGSTFFDGDETCSTQMFNIFIKKQSVSTPKAVQKQGVTRQFGTLLKETPVEPETELPKVVEETPTSEDTVGTLRKQLSTILETSEHGITQGTHSSGGTNATTKSTITSPNLQMVSEATLETSTAISLVTPKPRLQDRLAQEFDEQGLRRRPNNNEIGNFSRIEQREDTTPNIPCMSNLRFQEDKTETIPKSIIRFQEDKTETMPKLMFPTTAMFEGGEQTTGNIPKLPPILPAIEDDTFDFFTKTPDKVKVPKNVAPKQETNISSPLDQGNSKRVCNQLTPDLFYKPTQKFPEKLKNPIAIFEDEVPKEAPLLSATNQLQSQNPLHDSFLPDFSLCEDQKPMTAAPPKNPKLQEPDHSYIGNLSYVPETQEPTATNDESKVRQVQNNFEIYLDETMPETNERQLKGNETGGQAKIAPTTSIHPTLRLSSAVDKENAPSQTIIQKLTQACEAKPFIDDSISLNALTINEKKTTSMAHLTASFMKDFSEINNQSVKAAEPESTPSNNLSLMKSAKSTKDFQDNLIQNTNNHSKCEYDVNVQSSNSKQNDFFELNAATEMFATNISMIKNSTLLPNREFNKASSMKNLSAQNSIYLSEASNSDLKNDISRIDKASKPAIDLKNIKKERSVTPVSKIPLPNAKGQKSPTTINSANKSCTQLNIEDSNMSIYYKKTPRTPKQSQHFWDEEVHGATLENNHFIHNEANPDHTLLVTDIKSAPDPNVNPFNVDLINGFLEDVDFTLYIEKLPTCELVGHVKRLCPHTTITIKDQQFEVIKMIGEGAYGSVYSAKHVKTGKKYALKQERPPNHWEYNICLEIQSRIASDDMIPAFMCVDYAKIGNNASILASEFSTYGSLIAVCNKIKKNTSRNVDEYVVMHLTCQLLSIIDHLHAVNIIHADVKADNFLLMKNLKYPSDEICLQLIDFGVSIDMKRFTDRQAFNYVHNENEMKCIEMRMNRPWTYQLDLYGLAGVIHVLLFGKYMDVERHSPKGYWMPKERFPRYFNKSVWEYIFQTLLNIRDCMSMPNLQELRLTLKSELAEKEKYVSNMVCQFNRALNM